MAKKIVDLLEFVEVQAQQRDALAACLGRRNLMIELSVKLRRFGRPVKTS